MGWNLIGDNDGNWRTVVKTYFGGSLTKVSS
jgi:hypothetical protein